MSSTAGEDVALETLKSLRAIQDPFPTTRRPRWRRANVWVGVIIPLLLVWLFVEAYGVVFNLCAPWIREIYGSPRLATLYEIWCRVFFVYLAFTYLLVVLTPRGHSRPPKKPPSGILERSIVHEVANFDADLPRCFQDDCQGSWIPPRARHCKDCGVCVLAFDHHCVWFGRCISWTRTLKPFLLFMMSAVALIGVVTLPMFSLVTDHIETVRQTSWNSLELHEQWWSRWRSWAFGPVWHYAGGLVLAYRHHLGLDTEYKHPALRPSLTMLFVLVFAILVFLVGEVMLHISWGHVFRGVTTLEVERSKRAHLFDARRFVWIPVEVPTDESEDKVWSGAVIRVPPSAPLYDLGVRRNWELLMGEKWYHWINPLHSPCDGLKWQTNQSYVALLRDRVLKVE